MGIFEYLKELTDVQNQCRGYISAVFSRTFPAEPIYDEIRDLVIVQSFMKVYTAWENFLERSFIYYSLGGTSLSGSTLVCYIRPLNESHADLIIKGLSRYPDWSAHDMVIKLAENIFENGAPFKSTLQMASSHFTDMKKVRNAISHNSTKSNNEFETVVRNNLSAGKVGISIPEYLMSKKGTQPIFYEICNGYIHNSANTIASF